LSRHKFSKSYFIFASILPGEMMKYPPSGLVKLKGRMASWKESHVPLDRARESSTLTVSPFQKTDILLSDSLLVFMPEKDDQKMIHIKKKKERE
jgi:hypothetical protein